jgi:hypothetical protein
VNIAFLIGTDCFGRVLVDGQFAGNRNVLSVQWSVCYRGRNPVQREEFVQSAPVNTRQRV